MKKFARVLCFVLCALCVKAQQQQQQRIVMQAQESSNLPTQKIGIDDLV
jgi:hypothetical protein